MTVYVDDAFIPARVGRINARWCHLFADDEDELHAFAQGIGLKRSWYQQPKGTPGRPLDPSSLKAQMWHYDVTESVRARAAAAGAVEVTRREALRIMQDRHAARFPEAAARLRPRMAFAPVVNVPLPGLEQL